MPRKVGKYRSVMTILQVDYMGKGVRLHLETPIFVYISIYVYVGRYHRWISYKVIRLNSLKYGCHTLIKDNIQLQTKGKCDRNGM